MQGSVARSRVSFLGFVCLFLVGCGSSKVVEVSGKLTYQGKAVTNAYIHFVPESGGRPSIGETDRNGNFTLAYDPQTKGVERGKHKVFVMHNITAEPAGEDLIPGVTPRLTAEWTEFFRKYNSTNSTIEITIDKSIKDLKLEWN